MNIYPSDRTDKPVPTNDVSSVDRAEAERQSRDCACGGSGLKDIYYPEYTGEKSTMREINGIPRGVAMVIVAYCVCPAGRWMQQNQRKSAPEVYFRTPDLWDVRHGRTVWLEHNPSAPRIRTDDIPPGLGFHAIVAELTKRMEVSKRKAAR